MNNYRGFAAVYDLFMAKDIPYDAWVLYIDGILRKALPTAARQRKPLVMDLACGTGNITLRLAARGNDMIGVDASEDMLARGQSKPGGDKVLWLAQDMRKLNLYGTADAAVCTCDGLNYITTLKGLQEVFRRVRLFLNPGGVFIFDMNTEYKFKELMGSKIFGDSVGDACYQWENRYNPTKKINTYRVTFRVGEEVFTEVHRQRAYDIAEISNTLLAAGFASVRIRDNYTDSLPGAGTARVTYIAG